MSAHQRGRIHIASVSHYSLRWELEHQPLSREGPPRPNCPIVSAPILRVPAPQGEFSVPYAAHDICNQREKLREQRENVMLVVRAYNSERTSFSTKQKQATKKKRFTRSTRTVQIKPAKTMVPCQAEFTAPTRKHEAGITQDDKHGIHTPGTQTRMRERKAKENIPPSLGALDTCLVFVFQTYWMSWTPLSGRCSRTTFAGSIRESIRG